MNLLIITQKVDKADPILGFFHRWIEELSSHYSLVTVICLQRGDQSLPANVNLLSLGKETGPAKLKYLWRFYKYIWQERKRYDRVLVHMNQEYVLLAGFWWWLSGKRVFMWRNHYRGSWLTDLAAFWCNKIFCTSKFSYTAKYHKTVLMPVGVDTEAFRPTPGVVRQPHSVLFLARLAASKQPEILLKALANSAAAGIVYRATFCGPGDEAYIETLKDLRSTLQLTEYVQFIPGVPNSETPQLFSRHEIFVNCSPSGMFDKTIFESAACGCLTIASSQDWASLAGSEFSFANRDSEGLSDKLRQLSSLSAIDRRGMLLKLEHCVAGHALSLLGRRLRDEMR